MQDYEKLGIFYLGHALNLAITDPLTGLYNQRYLLRHLEALLERAPRAPVSPSGNRLTRGPRAALTVSKTCPALAIGTLPTR